MASRRPESILRGRQSKASGEQFERLITAACLQYRVERAAEIEKTPEPMKPISGMHNGRFTAIYTKQAQPDFKGTLAGGQSIVFEAKYTGTGRIKQEAVTETQAGALDRHRQMGAGCFVLVSFSFRSFYRVPWRKWRTMQDWAGHKYLTPGEMNPAWEIRTDQRGILRFLP